MNVQVSGVTSMKQLQQLDAMNIEFAGLVFYKPSPRYVVDKIEPGALIQADPDIKTVGMFQNSSFDEIMEAVETYKLHLVQLCGDEDPLLCEQLSSETEVIKAFTVGESTKDLDDLVEDFDEVCDYYLFDTAAKKGVGTEGKKFDWDKIAKARIEKPFFICGGITPDDAPRLKKFKHPDFFGVGINSHFEKSPGVKDMALILQFVHALKLSKR